MMYLFLYSYLYAVYFDLATSHKIFFSCISASSLSYVQRFFCKMKLVKVSLHSQKNLACIKY